MLRYQSVELISPLGVHSYWILSRQIYALSLDQESLVLLLSPLDGIVYVFDGSRGILDRTVRSQALLDVIRRQATFGAGFRLDNRDNRGLLLP